MLYLPEALTVGARTCEREAGLILHHWFAGKVHYGEEASLIIVEGAEDQLT